MNAPALALDRLSALDDPLELQRYTRFSGEAEAAVAESSLQLAGMHCAACAGLIEQALCEVDGVLDAQVSGAAQRALVRWDPRRTRASALVSAIRGAGYDAVPDTAAQARGLRVAESRKLLWRVFVAGFCAMQVMMMATPSYVAAPGELTDDLARLLNWGSWLLTLPVMWFSAVPFFTGAWQTLRRGRIGMDVPVALGIAVAFIGSTGAAFDPTGVFGSEVYFDSLTMFVSFLLLGRYLEMKARHRAADSLERALGSLPETAQRMTVDGTVETVSVQRLHAGDRVVVPVGAAFPADGRLDTGATDADEALLSGESHPVAKAAGDAVIAGSVNLRQPVTMTVERVGGDTRYEQIVAMVREAMSQRPDAARLADRIAGPFLWAVLLLAGGGALAWQHIDPSRSLWVAVSVLIVTCPCALGLSAPAALLSAAGGLARRGVLLRRLEALETLSQVTQVVLDKTGTVTDTRPAWRGAVALTADAERDKPRLLEAAAALAGWSAHPLSCALSDAAGSTAVAASSSWLDVREQPGAGLEACDAAGRRWRLGSADWVGAPHHDDDGLQVWFGPVDGDPQLLLQFDEALRPDATAAAQALQSQGLTLALLSGDGDERVQRLAHRLGVTHAVGLATPERKLEVLRQLQAAGARVAMVGDGVNDAPVLAQADVSFAMGHGAVVARVHADAVLLGGRLQDVALAHRLSRRTVRVIRQNLAWSALYNFSCVPLALAGYLPPWAAGLGMAASSLLVVGNAMRLARTES